MYLYCEIQKVVQADLSEVFLFKQSQYAAKNDFQFFSFPQIAAQKINTFSANVNFFH